MIKEILKWLNEESVTYPGISTPVRQKNWIFLIPYILLLVLFGAILSMFL